MDQSGDRSRTFHGVREPDIQRHLGGLAAGADEERNRRQGDPVIADLVVSYREGVIDGRELYGPEVPQDRQGAEQDADIADTIDNEGLVGSGRGGMLLEVETDQQIRAEPYALPPDEHHQVVVAEDERQHGEHEEVQVAEEPVVPALVRHVADGIDVDQHSDAGDEEQPDAGERIEEEAGIGRSAQRVYMRSNISAQSWLSVPPAPALIST